MSKSSGDRKGGSSSTTKSSSSDNDFDWIFDYILQFLESETFDHSIMNFIDEKCIHFDSEDENKFIYTDIHREFKDHVETLILSNLGELGITSELFYESCEKGRNGRDINRNVFERLVAMDDFLTFKKIMVKRNLELQLEAFRTFININSPQKGGSGAASNKTTSPITRQKDGNSSNIIDDDDDDMDDVMQQSLMELELMHRQEQLEQAQLEQAVALSLAIEEERIRKIVEKANQDALELETSSKAHYSYNSNSKDDNSKEDDVQDSISVNYSIHNNTYRATSISANQDDTYLNAINDNATCDNKGDKSDNINEDNNNVTTKSKTKQSNKNNTNSAISNNKLNDMKFADPKPLKINSNILGARPLPAIGAGKNSDSSSLNELTNELNKKKREVESNFKENQLVLQQQKEEAEMLRKHLSVDPDEAEKRAAYMREQRDRLIAMKKAERERAAGVDKSYAGRFDNNNENADKVMEAINRIQSEKANPSGADAKGGSPDSSMKGLSADEVERRRSIMAMALARRMKLELIESEESRLTSKFASDYSAAFGDSNGAFSELDRSLKSMSLSRVENRERQVLLAEKNKLALKKKKSNVVESDVDDGYYN